MAAPSKQYISGGRVLSSPPLTARIRTAGTDVYNFVGLYVTTLFTLDPEAAARNSQFAVRNRAQFDGRPGATTTGRSGGYGGSGSGSSGGGNSPWSGGGGRRVGTVDDVRGPECRSCQS